MQRTTSQKDDQRKQVCALLFRNTLGISDRFIRTVKSKSKGGFLSMDSRWKKPRSVVPGEIKTAMRNHISSIPAVGSHYCRTDSKINTSMGVKTVADLYNDFVMRKQ
uniref:DNA ligase n=1 Tax=Lygus hesperus TaxID=30085 RepID=A0A0A9XCD7_LYGHE